MKQEYIHLFTPDYIGTFSLITKEFTGYNPWRLTVDTDLQEQLSTLSLFAYGYRSEFPDILNHKFERNREGDNKASEMPVKIHIGKILELITKPEKRGRSNNSLTNLKTLTSENRYTPSLIYTPEIIEKAISLKASGMNWRAVGAQLDLNHTGLSSAVSRYQRDNSNQVNGEKRSKKLNKKRFIHFYRNKGDFEPFAIRDTVANQSMKAKGLQLQFHKDLLGMDIEYFLDCSVDDLFILASNLVRGADTDSHATELTFSEVKSTYL